MIENIIRYIKLTEPTQKRFVKKEPTDKAIS